MKLFTTLRTIIFLSLLAILTMSFAGSGKITTHFMEWRWSDCEHQAKIRNKPIFIFVGATYCNISSRMNNIFRQKEVGQLLNENFVCNKMTTEGIANNFRASNWGVTHVPSYLFFNSRGKLIYKAEGFKDKDNMILEIQTAMEKINEAN